MEKPISGNLVEAKKIIKLCKKNNIKLYVNNRRLSKFYQTFKKILKKKFENQILSFSAWCSSGMHAIGIHMVDLLRNICGDIKSVYATQEKNKIKYLPYSKNFDLMILVLIFF